MAKMDKQLKKWQDNYNDFKIRTESIERILLSFHLLVDKMTGHLPTYRASTMADLKKVISTLKGPLMSPTKKKLRKLSVDFEGLVHNLRKAALFFNSFRTGNSEGADYNALYQNYIRDFRAGLVE